VKRVCGHPGDVLGKGWRGSLKDLVGDRAENAVDGGCLLKLDMEAIVEGGEVLLEYFLF
jgi:hypothetical protein